MEKVSTFIGGGYVKLRRALFEHTACGVLSPNDTYIFIALVSFADAKSGTFTGAASVLASWTGLGENSVTDAMGRLEAKNYILRNFIQGRKSYYKILIDKYPITVGNFKHYRVNLGLTRELSGVPAGALKQQTRKELRANIELAVTYPVYERDPDNVYDEVSEAVYEKQGDIVTENVTQNVNYTRLQDFNTSRGQDPKTSKASKVSKVVSQPVPPPPTESSAVGRSAHSLKDAGQDESPASLVLYGKTGKLQFDPETGLWDSPTSVFKQGDSDWNTGEQSYRVIFSVPDQQPAPELSVAYTTAVLFDMLVQFEGKAMVSSGQEKVHPLTMFMRWNQETKKGKMRILTAEQLFNSWFSDTEAGARRQFGLWLDEKHPNYTAEDVTV